MTDEQEEAIKILEAQASTKVEENHYLIFHKEATVTALNMLKEKDKEIEKLKKALARNVANNFTTSMKETEKSKEDLEMLNKGWQIELEKKDKIIDLILDKVNLNYAKIFDNSEAKEIIEIYEKIKNTNNLSGLELRKSCIKQYFKQKATNDS